MRKHHSKRPLPLLLALLCLTGCGGGDSTADASGQTTAAALTAAPVETETASTSTNDAASIRGESNAATKTASTPETVETAETAAPTETTVETAAPTETMQPATIAGTTTSAPTTGETTTTASAIMTSYSSSYGFSVDIPVGFSPVQGATAASREITDTTAVFQSAAGDTMTVVITEGADNPADFQTITPEQISSALGEYMTTVALSGWEFLQIDGWDAYRFTVSGAIDTQSLSLEQLVANCPGMQGGDKQFTFFYTNVSGAEKPYSGGIETYFHFFILE